MLKRNTVTHTNVDEKCIKTRSAKAQKKCKTKSTFALSIHVEIVQLLRQFRERKVSFHTSLSILFSSHLVYCFEMWAKAKTSDRCEKRKEKKIDHCHKRQLKCRPQSYCQLTFKSIWFGWFSIFLSSKFVTAIEEKHRIEYLTLLNRSLTEKNIIVLLHAILICDAFFYARNWC